MTLTYDRDADAFYIYLTDPTLIRGNVAETTGYWPFHLDKLKDGSLGGIEILDVSALFPPAFLSNLDTKSEGVCVAKQLQQEMVNYLENYLHTEKNTNILLAGRRVMSLLR